MMSDKYFTLNRSFDAPRELVWKAWSDGERLGQWWGPKEAAITVASLEFRPGGFFHYGMQFPGSPQMWGRFMYREIAAPERIVWLNSFSNEGCGITAAPFGEPFPLEVRSEVTLTEHAGKTTISLRAIPHGANEAEQAVFYGMFGSMEQGWGGTFDQLAEHLTQG
jgi:uncharacterized protein YndB with AHSA1/START domain